MSFIWSAQLAYIVGLIATDGNLSKDGRHLDITSKDQDLLLMVEEFLQTKNKIGIKSSPSHMGRRYFRLQFSHVKFYKFLVSIGLNPNKSKTIGKLTIPDEYFADFLRGCWDGDGFSYSYWDKRWRSSFMFYSGITSASPNFLNWLKKEIQRLFGINGTIKTSGKTANQLIFAKWNSYLLMKNMYYCDTIMCLERKRLKNQSAIDIINK